MVDLSQSATHRHPTAVCPLPQHSPSRLPPRCAGLVAVEEGPTQGSARGQQGPRGAERAGSHTPHSHAEMRDRKHEKTDTFHLAQLAQSMHLTEESRRAARSLAELKQANASLREGLVDLQAELDAEKALFRAHFAQREVQERLGAVDAEGQQSAHTSTLES